jgi:hypothetical protein
VGADVGETQREHGRAGLEQGLGQVRPRVEAGAQGVEDEAVAEGEAGDPEHELEHDQQRAEAAEQPPAVPRRADRARQPPPERQQDGPEQRP